MSSGVWNQLNHQDHHQPRFWIDAIHRTVAPPQPNEPRCSCRWRRNDRRSRIRVRSPRPVAEWRVADLVGRHELDRVRRQDAHPVERAAAAHRLEEACVVARRRNQSRAAGEALARPVDVVPWPRAPSGARTLLPSCRCRRRRRADPCSAGGRKNCVSFMPSGP